MSENKIFTPEQDKIILYLYEQLKIKKWALVAKKVSEECKIERNAKQCRDRYCQFLNPTYSSQWTPEEEKQLYRLHNSVGNKWALIASCFPNKTDNLVKNHFYSKLRKALRHLNKIIKLNYRREFKEIKIGTIYKIIQGFQQQFKQKPIVSQQISDECCILKDNLISFADETEEIQSRIDCSTFSKQRILILRILQFSKAYKKKSKKQKRDSLQIEELFKPAKKIQLITSLQKKDEDSQFQKVSQIDSSEQENDDNQKEIFDRNDSMVQEKEDIRKSPPIYVIFKQDENLRESPSSIRSGIDIRLSDPLSSNKMQDQDNKLIQNNQLVEPNLIQKQSFGFLRGQSSFRSYRSQSGYSKSSHSKTDMFGDLRVSAKCNDIMENQIESLKDQNIFRSQK